tara:strand:- start:146 stop:508 length:363 start_codon:yes stop_codon:yes gene_type:complete
MEDTIYRETILHHYKHPEYFGRLKNPDKTETVLNPLCGDTLVIDIKEKDGKIVEIAWEGEGCAISQAAMSLVSGEIVGKNKNAILTLTIKDIYKLMGAQVSFLREKCAALPLVGLKRLFK